MATSIIDFESARVRAGDHMVRGSAAYGMVRAFAVSARGVVQAARDAHDTSPVVTAALGRLMMGALMTGAMFKQPDELLTYIVQLMHDCIDEVAERVERNLASVTSVTDMLRAGATPTDVLGRVLEGLDYQELEAQPVEFYCGCNEQRAARATMALGEDELRDMIAKNETAEVCCHFCGRRHYLAPERLRELLG